jgi:hypothetical protein
MLIQCTSKGCYTQDHHLLDATTNDITCNTCGEVIDVPVTTKKALRSMGQIRRTPKSGVQIKCKACGHSGKPLLKTLSGGVSVGVCRKCSKQLDVHPSFILAMKELGAEYSTDTESVEGGDV